MLSGGSPEPSSIYQVLILALGPESTGWGQMEEQAWSWPGPPAGLEGRPQPGLRCGAVGTVGRRNPRVGAGRVPGGTALQTSRPGSWGPTLWHFRKSGQERT